ncbi:MAG TPA: class I SAM-dependent methyltransferase [Pseudonocardiaceae bacterium]
MTEDGGVDRLAAGNVLYRKPALYDAMFAGGRRGAEVIALLVARYGPAGASSVLDAGCGTGRDLADLAVLEPGLAGIGVDRQAGLVEYGRRVRPHLDLRVGDLRTMRLGRSFDVVLCVGNTAAYLHDDRALVAAWETFAAHSGVGTLLVVQTLLGVPATGPARTAAVRAGGYAAEVTSGTEYDADSRIATTRRRWVFRDGRVAEDVIRRRVLLVDELWAGLGRVGFEPRLLSGDPAAPTAGTTTDDVPPVAYAVATWRG